MEPDTPPSGIGGILAILADVSRRPRYAFLVLQLVAEVADASGKAGPVVMRSGAPVMLRDWLCSQLLPLSEQAGRRSALRARVTSAMQDQLTGDVVADSVRIDQAVEEQVLAAGRTNVSRAMSDLVRAGLATRHYAGYATNHRNRGGGRHAVYVIRREILDMLRRPARGDWSVRPADRNQGELFAA